LLDAGTGALELIHHVVQDGPQDAVLSFYVSRLQAAQEHAPSPQPAAASAGCNAPVHAIDMLSERETKVVGLLAQALPNKKIARTLGISPETVKWHLKNIYGKLGVSSRDEAVARVRDLELGVSIGHGDHASI
jgi:LuxR family transcriptional regulator, maltose regulon positive regulatory protein